MRSRSEGPEDRMSAVMRGAALSCVLALSLVLLQGCGRKGAPEKPEGSEYPREYPYNPSR